MKKNIYKLFIALFVTSVFAACTEEEGKEPGHDPKPVITIYQYKASRPLNPDNDLNIRIAANSKTEEVYYLAEKTVDRDNQVASIGEDAYADYVVENGTKVEGISGASNADIPVTDMYGKYTITFVGIGSGAKHVSTVQFTGLEWTDVVSGTYKFSKPSVTGIATQPTTLQVCTTDDKLFRFKDVFGTGYHMKINLIDIKGKDADGEYTYFRVPLVDTPFLSTNNDTQYPVNARDIGYWQGNDAYITDHGYESGMYGDYYCFICIQYFISPKSLGYGYDEFIPNN